MMVSVRDGIAAYGNHFILTAKTTNKSSKPKLPLTIILAVIGLFFIPMFWPLHPVPGDGRP
jgi:hypothetical protein